MTTDLMTNWTVQRGVAPGRLPSCLQGFHAARGHAGSLKWTGQTGPPQSARRIVGPTGLGARDPASPVGRGTHLCLPRVLAAGFKSPQRQARTLPDPQTLPQHPPRRASGLFMSCGPRLGIHPKLIIRRTTIYGLRTFASAFKQQSLETIQVYADFLNSQAKSEMPSWKSVLKMGNAKNMK